MSRVIAVTNLKGGIGKTTTVVNVGAGLALKGVRTLLVDVDAQGNLAMALGVAPRRTLYEAIVDDKLIIECITNARPNLDIIGADESLLAAQPTLSRRPDWIRVLDMALQPVKHSYDVILIDCGASLTVMNINALHAASGVIAPTTLEPLSIRGLDMLIKQLMHIKNGASSVRMIIPTMFDATRQQSADLLEQLRADYGAAVTAPIRAAAQLAESAAAGCTIYEHDPRSSGALDYARLVEHLSKLWNIQPTAAVAARSSESAQPTAPTDAPEPAVVPAMAESAAASAPLEMLAPPSFTPAASNVLPVTCPHCGQPLQRATVAGYRVAYCDHCKYRQQELASGMRR